MGRLKLTPSKLNDLCKGLESIAEKSHGILGRSLRKIKVSDQLILEQITVPIGNILVIFESRPDCLPQIAGLCIATGNGIIAKGGKEALNSNRCIFTLIRQALSKHDVSDAICLVNIDISLFVTHPFFQSTRDDCHSKFNALPFGNFLLPILWH